MKKWIYIALIVVFAAAFAISGWMLFDYYYTEDQAEEAAQEMSQKVEQLRQENPVIQQTDPTGPAQIVWPRVEVTDPETGEMVSMLPEFAELYTQNNDIVGWIRLDGTKVDYPVMQTPEHTDYYLKRGFDKKRTARGSIYVREECDVFAPSDNVTIYGHRMNSGSMFGELHKLKKVEFWADHRYIQFDTLLERHTYEIFAVFRISASVNNGFQYHLYVDMTQLEFDDYVAQCKDRALFDTGITPQYGEKLITLSTCEKDNNSIRLVVVARQIEIESE